MKTLALSSGITPSPWLPVNVKYCPTKGFSFIVQNIALMHFFNLFFASISYCYVEEYWGNLLTIYLRQVTNMV